MIGNRYDPNRHVGYESSKLYRQRCEDGFWDAFIAGRVVLDIGYRGGTPDALPIVEGAIGVEQDMPGYDGLNLLFPDNSVDTIHASHVLEHVEPSIAYLREWHRVLRIDGTMILMVPHAYLYERRLTVPPSRWSPEHLRSYTPGSLLTEIEQALEPNSYRVEYLADNDVGYYYDIPSDTHPVGCLEIVCVLRKRAVPAWNVEP